MAGLSSQSSVSATPNMLTLFALGFRPFFLLAGVLAAAIMPLWLTVWMGYWPLAAYFSPLTWHAHEMLYGYAVAVIAGFLLTAVRNWTGMTTPSGASLAALAALWLLARLLLLCPAASMHTLTALLDLSFLPALMLAIGIPLVRYGKWQNTAILIILALMLGGNGIVHFAMLTDDAALVRRGLDIGLYAIILVIVILGGRVIPFFIRGAIPHAEPKSRPALEIASIAALIAAAIAGIGDAPAVMTGTLAATAAVLHAVRLAGWYCNGLWHEPLLWVLYLGYAWIVVGLALTAGATSDLVPPAVAMHALMAGSISVTTIGMMARVALGHSGRRLQATRLTVAAFYLINIAAVCRVAGPLLLPENTLVLITLSGTLFTASILCFLWVYTPILVTPRIDGKPG